MAGLINTYPISTKPIITSNELLRQLQAARMRGGANDYFGLGAALRGVGNDYEQMQRDQDQMRQLNAKADSGYYPAQAASQVAGFNLGAYENADKLQTQQDLKRAFQEVVAEGKQPGTPQFELSMQQKMQTYGGVRGMAPYVKSAQKQLQDQAIQMAYLKQTAEHQVANQVYQNYYQQYKSKGLPDQQAMQLGWQDALNHIQQDKPEVQIDPHTGIAKVLVDGQEYPLDNEALATAAEIGGNGDAAKAIREFAKSKGLYSEENTKSALKQKDLEKAQLQKEFDLQISQAKNDAGLNRRNTLLERLYQERGQAQRNLVTAMKDVNVNPAAVEAGQDHIQALQKEIDAITGGGGQTGQSTPVNPSSDIQRFFPGQSDMGGGSFQPTSLDMKSLVSMRAQAAQNWQNLVDRGVRGPQLEQARQQVMAADQAINSTLTNQGGSDYGQNQTSVLAPNISSLPNAGSGVNSAADLGLPPWALIPAAKNAISNWWNTPTSYEGGLTPEQKATLEAAQSQ